jgi:hypothetical protein
VVEADAPKALWARDFQFDGKAIKIAPMNDEYTRVALLHVVERSIAAERLVTSSWSRFRRGVRSAEDAAHLEHTELDT